MKFFDGWTGINIDVPVTTDFSVPSHFLMRGFPGITVRYKNF